MRSNLHTNFSRRVIGETPPHMGGVIAHAYISPLFLGEVAMHYKIAGQEWCVRLANYKEARSAAIRAIFSEQHEFRDVSLTSVGMSDRAKPFYATAGAWFAEQHEFRKKASA